MEPSRTKSLSDVELPELDVTRPAAEQIFAAVKVAILRMDLPPDCLVSENEVGQKIGASRTPVREAFTQLREDGLIVTRPSRGNFVSRLSEHRIREAQFIREGLELNNLKRLCHTGLTDQDQESLHAVLERQANCVAKSGDLEFQTHDDHFHEILASATGYERASTLLKREKTALDRLRILSLSDAHRKRDLLDQHRLILETVIAGNEKKACLLMQDHLRAVLSDLASLVAEHRSFFE
ncbi:GntR family transcriptional regulator [Shimia isoporae]|uniref:GntR family transcriptional regulator n=1 Tax=Shimia isoporae TaxID=647720 RepID=A0A4R1NAE6_9RHOB|nr:GntR family transcriptional regulator [Shimia isoporae]TCL00792.1 GntR family transcriptional regulator [Shimia isoporae]